MKIENYERPESIEVSGKTPELQETPTAGLSTDFSTRIMAILFADAVKFSKLEEKENNKVSEES